LANEKLTSGKKSSLFHSPCKASDFLTKYWTCARYPW